VGPHVGEGTLVSSRSGSTIGAPCLPCSGTLRVGLDWYLKPGVSPTGIRLLCSWTRPTKLDFFYFYNLNLICKLWKPHFWSSKIYQTFKSDRMRDSEELYFLDQVQIPNRILVKILGSQTAFEFELNLFEVQTCLEKSNKFPKIHICLGLQECEFILAWLYGKICNFHPSPI
jgi:hypothetical protein